MTPLHRFDSRSTHPKECKVLILPCVRRLKDITVLHLCVVHENLLGQLVNTCMYIAYTCTYAAHHCSSLSVHGSSLFIPLNVCTWFILVHPGSPVSAENISLRYAVCTCLYSAVPALNNSMVQESAIWYRQGS
jgi:hypothetical protein